MNKLESNLAAINQRIEAACASSGRSPRDVLLIGVSKTKPAGDVRLAYELGLRHFGENYLAEAIEKINSTRDLQQAVWHFIGRIQSNKTRQIAEHFDWVHTVDRPKIAQRLNDQCPPGKRLNVLLQVNIDADPNKGGISPEQADTLLQAVCKLPNLQPRGLMTILAAPDSAGVGYRSMAQLAADLRPTVTRLCGGAGGWDTLSMGMTADLDAAVAAGATQIRIGTALFGPRT